MPPTKGGRQDLPTNLQVLHGLLPHLRLRITLGPQGSQVGGVKVQMSGARHQAVVKPGPPLGIPEHRLDGLQPQSRGALVRRRRLPVTCQEAACQRYATSSFVRPELSPDGEVPARSPRTL